MTTTNADTTTTAPSVPAKTDSPIWKTIRLGTGLRTPEDFIRAFKEASCKMCLVGMDNIFLALSFPTSGKEVEIELIALTVAELGFAKGACRLDIYNRAQELGFELCPAEVGPQLRLQYDDQPHDEWLNIGMEPLLSYTSEPHLFCVNGHPKASNFGAVTGRTNCLWAPYDKWVFVKPRN